MGHGPGLASLNPLFHTRRRRMTDRAAWQLPAFTATVLASRRHDHALVIPVINEGDRIRAQLERLAVGGACVCVRALAGSLALA
jgi:hypothetical protein